MCPGCPIRLSASRPPPQAPRVINNNRGLAAIGVLRQEERPPSDPCVPSPCGVGAQCRSTGNRAVSQQTQQQKNRRFLERQYSLLTT